MSFTKALILAALLSSGSASAVNLLSPLSFNVLLAPVKTPVRISNPLGGIASLQALAVARAVIGSFKRRNKQITRQKHNINEGKNELKFVIPNHPLNTLNIKPQIQIHTTNRGPIPTNNGSVLRISGSNNEPVVLPNAVAYTHRTQQIFFNPLGVSPLAGNNHYYNRVPVRQPQVPIMPAQLPVTQPQVPIMPPQLPMTQPRVPILQQIPLIQRQVPVRQPQVPSRQLHVPLSSGQAIVQPPRHFLQHGLTQPYPVYQSVGQGPMKSRYPTPSQYSLRQVPVQVSSYGNHGPQVPTTYYEHQTPVSYQHQNPNNYNPQQHTTYYYGQSSPLINYSPQQPPTNYNPQQPPTNYNHQQLPTNYNHQQTPTNYNPQQPQTNYNHQQPQINYNPQQLPTNYNPQQTNYNPQQTNYNPKQPPTNYNLQQPPANYNLQQPQINYNPQQPQVNYNPQQLQSNYNPQQLQSNYNPQSARNYINFQQPSYTINSQQHHQVPVGYYNYQPASGRNEVHQPVPRYALQVSPTFELKPTSGQSNKQSQIPVQIHQLTSVPEPQRVDVSLLNKPEIQFKNYTGVQNDNSKYLYYYMVKIAHPRPKTKTESIQTSSSDVITVASLFNQSITLPELTLNDTKGSDDDDTLADIDKGNDVTISESVDRRGDNETGLSFTSSIEPRLYTINLESKPVFVYNYYKLYQLDQSGLKACTIDTCDIRSKIFNQSYDGVANEPFTLDKYNSNKELDHSEYPRYRDGNQSYDDKDPSNYGSQSYDAKDSSNYGSQSYPRDEYYNEDSTIERTITKYIKQVLVENDSDHCASRLLCEVDFLLKLLRKRTSNLNVVLRLRRSASNFNSDVIVESIAKSGCYENYRYCPSLDIEYLLRKIITVQFHR